MIQKNWMAAKSGEGRPVVIISRGVVLSGHARRSLDFLHDRFAWGRRVRVPNIVGDVKRECLAAIPDTER